MSEDSKTTLSGLDPQKRATLRKLIKGSAFAIPVVVSFSMTEVGLSKSGSPGGSNITV